eukprot:2462778-Pyramimonas_sp.AAC.1
MHRKAPQRIPQRQLNRNCFNSNAPHSPRQRTTTAQHHHIDKTNTWNRESSNNLGRRSERSDSISSPKVHPKSSDTFPRLQKNYPGKAT